MLLYCAFLTQFFKLGFWSAKNDLFHSSVCTLNFYFNFPNVKHIIATSVLEGDITFIVIINLKIFLLKCSSVYDNQFPLVLKNIHFPQLALSKIDFARNATGNDSKTFSRHTKNKHQYQNESSLPHTKSQNSVFLTSF